MSNDVDIVVLGGGPSGVITAIGLVKLGYSVILLYKPRRFNSYESISERLVQIFNNLELKLVVNALPKLSPRTVFWNQQCLQVNSSHIVSRDEIDQLLIMEARLSGVHCVEANVQKVLKNEKNNVKVKAKFYSEKINVVTINARFAVDARGRLAPVKSFSSSIRGPETIAINQQWINVSGEASTLVYSFNDGWAWLARLADGRCFSQITFSAKSEVFNKKKDYLAATKNRLECDPAKFYMQGAKLIGVPSVRISTSVLHYPAVKRNIIAVGDAASAIDPLSGNGIYQAVSTALIVPSVVNTILVTPEKAGLAERFYSDRVRNSFYNSCRAGRDFYAMEKNVGDQPFWSERSKWPDNKPSYDEIELKVIGFDIKPVVENGLIRAREVVMTSDQPQGVWLVSDINIVPIAKFFINRVERIRPVDILKIVGRYTGNNQDITKKICSWLYRYKII